MSITIAQYVLVCQAKKPLFADGVLGTAATRHQAVDMASSHARAGARTKS